SSLQRISISAVPSPAATTSKCASRLNAADALSATSRSRCELESVMQVLPGLLGALFAVQNDILELYSNWPQVEAVMLLLPDHLCRLHLAGWDLPTRNLDGC